MEDKYPGLWQTWFKEQIVAVGWPPDSFPLHGPTNESSWRSARQNLLRIQPGDKVIVQLKNWRVGRIGTVLHSEIEDAQWTASVPTQGDDIGEMGRRVSTLYGNVQTGFLKIRTLFLFLARTLALRWIG
jgi:hypothetical protein